MSETTNYPILIFWSDEDEGFIAVVPDLKGCTAFGHTLEEALAEVQVAMEGWLVTARKHGIPIPVPTAHPTIVPAAS